MYRYYHWQEIYVYFIFDFNTRYGPNGTAICVYHAHFKGNTGFTNLNYRGIIDVFSFNEYKDELGMKDGEDNILNVRKEFTIEHTAVQNNLLVRGIFDNLP